MSPLLLLSDGVLLSLPLVQLYQESSWKPGSGGYWAGFSSMQAIITTTVMMKLVMHGVETLGMFLIYCFGR
jgi:hypothetical protein